jgi:hypothetical protein
MDIDPFILYTIFDSIDPLEPYYYIEHNDSFTCPLIESKAERMKRRKEKRSEYDRKRYLARKAKRTTS